MTVHELILELQKIPNQNLEVWTTTGEDEEPIESISVASNGYYKVVFIDNYYHQECPPKREEQREMPRMLKAFWSRKLLESINGKNTKR